MNKKLIILPAILTILVVVVIFWVQINNEHSSPKSKNSGKTTKNSLSDGYFYHKKIPVSFHYPEKWGDINLQKIKFDNEVFRSRSTGYEYAKGSFAYGRFAENSSAYFILRSRNFNVDPVVDNDKNDQLFTSLGTSSKSVLNVYEQMGGGGYYKDSSDNYRTYPPPKLPEDNKLPFNSSEIADVEAENIEGIILPKFERKNKERHVAVFNITTDSNKTDENYTGMVFVNLTNAETPEQEFMSAIQSATLN